MNLWQKLTVIWPCALGDFLWAMLVVAPAALLDRLTWRLALRLTFQLIMLYLLIRFFTEIVSMDITFLFTLDATVYWEVGATLFALTARGRAGQTLGAAARWTAHATGAAVRAVPRFAARQRRNAQALRRRLAKSSDDDEPAGVYAFI